MIVVKTIIGMILFLLLCWLGICFCFGSLQLFFFGSLENDSNSFIDEAMYYTFICELIVVLVSISIFMGRIIGNLIFEGVVI